jgi:Mg2+ and Co2+ transporter CorA
MLLLLLSAAHHNNTSMQMLAVVSTIFLPITFLAGGLWLCVRACKH